MSSYLLYSDCYGDVYKVTKNDEINLVKIIKSNNLKTKNQIDTLNNMKNLSLHINPNLSEYVDFYFDENGDFEIYMEYDEDSEFKLKIDYNKENHRTFEEDYIWNLTIQILNLLKYIQKNKDIKIDINPSKILLMDNGTLKVFDYGLELISNMGLSCSISQNIDNTMPPELVNEENKSIDENAINIWKAGCIIYQLITLKEVFEFESIFDMQMKLSEFKGVYDINIDSKYSEDFKILLSKMLIAEPEKRATVDELLNCEIIRKRNLNILEKEKLEKKLLTASILTFKQSILKSSIKDSLRQIQNQNEMMENDKYEILKFSLGKNSEIDNINKNLDIGNKEINFCNNYLKQTGFFGGGSDEAKKSVKIDDFREKIIAEKLRKEKENLGIIDKKDFNYYNPYRNKNNDIIIKENENEYNNDNILNIDKHNNKGNKQEIIKLNNFEKEKEITPSDVTKNKRYYLDKDKNINSIKTRAKPKNKDTLPKLNNHFNSPNVIISKELKKNNNNIINNNNLVKKTENILNLLNKQKGKKFDGTNKRKKLLNNNNLSSMSNAQIDAILNNILHKQNIKLVNKIQKQAVNLGNNNINKNNLANLNKPTDNKIKLKPIPIAKPLNNLQNAGNNKNNKKVTYGTVEYKSKKGKNTKHFPKK